MAFLSWHGNNVFLWKSALLKVSNNETRLSQTATVSFVCSFRSLSDSFRTCFGRMRRECRSFRASGNVLTARHPAAAFAAAGSALICLMSGRYLPQSSKHRISYICPGPAASHVAVGALS